MGLERFVNTGDALESYRALGKAWPSLWPTKLYKAGEPVAWAPELHLVFLTYRDVLRLLWEGSPHYQFKNEPLRFLLGIRGSHPWLAEFGKWFEWSDSGDAAIMKARFNSESELSEDVAKVRAFEDALQADPPKGEDLTTVHLDWGSGEFSYVPANDFQRALYLLFRESWRAKVCKRCATYFIAQKPARIYCSVGCSNAAHVAQARKWWRRTRGSKESQRPKTRRSKR